MRDFNYAHQLNVLSPEQSLWKRLATLLSPEEIAMLRAERAIQVRRYVRCGTLNKQARWVALMERSSRGDNLEVAKWRAILTDPKAYVFSEETSK